jgi:maltooligosyltrehalose trehalohydrolase
MTPLRRLPVGAEVQRTGGVHFRVWAPKRRAVAVLVGERAAALAPEGDGYFSGTVADARASTRYRYQLDGGTQAYPDPASRFQPEGPHGPSQVVDPASFRWTDAGWPGVARTGQVLYELHVGTFTPAGTWAAAEAQLPELARLGITVIEMLPIADFPGRFGWGYDGVNLFAPTHLYGEPDDLRRFIDAAHGQGIGVILDVVYNHLGPDGNYLGQFAQAYFTERYQNEWGQALNFDGPDASPVREYFLANAGYWIDEFHFDGLRLDATHQIFDESYDHLLAEVAKRVREAARGKATLITAENEVQEARLARPAEQGGFGLDALWNDDFHHSAMVALAARNEAYYSDYHGRPGEFVAAAKWGFLYQGQHHFWQRNRRGSPALDLEPSQFVTFLQNHDQVANSGMGLRCHAQSSPARFRAMTALLLLGPNTPMLFQGQEFAASAPFLFFADHHPELAQQVSVGRRKFLAQFRSLALPEMQAHLAEPSDPETFHRCILDFSERERNAAVLELHRDLIRLRRSDPVLSAQRARGLDGAVLGSAAFLLRYFDPVAGDRLLLVNLGRDLHLLPAPEPLLAPPAGTRWKLHWSSEDPRYGGGGTPEPETETEGWRLLGESALFLLPAS